MNHWVVQCNPKHWRIREFFRDGHDTPFWTIRRHWDRIAKGDDAALWLSGPQRGVVALGEVAGEAVWGTPPLEDEAYWAPGNGRESGRWTVPIRFDRVFLDRPVPASQLMADERFAGAQIVRTPFGANPFPLDPQAWRAIEERAQK